jgi:hypothetical protein
MAMRLANSSRTPVLFCLWVGLPNRYLCFNSFFRYSIGSHCLGGTRSTKGRHLVGSDDYTDDAYEKGIRYSVSVLCVCGNIGNEHATDYGNGAFDCLFGGKFEADFHKGMH